MEKGYLMLILHAHLPYVRHPEHNDFLEERWLYEAITETYIPLINVFDGLINDGIDFRVTLSLTPPLMSMLRDELLLNRYGEHLNKLIELSEKEVERTSNMYQISEVTKMYRKKLYEIADTFYNKYNRDLVSAFNKFQEGGYIEILCCAATHGYLPLMDMYPESLNAQIKVGVDTYKNFLGKYPSGIWLPECGYTRDIDKILNKNNIKFFIGEGHCTAYADPQPEYGSLSPICSTEGIIAFPRDLESSKQVWSANEGYPGDYYYREFYRDIGYELDYEYLKPYLPTNGLRAQTGFKYYRTTGNTEDKQAYIPEIALEKASEHAANFMFNRENQIKYYAPGMEKPPLIVCPYDAELFGHWWFEGIDWLNFLLRKIAYDQNIIKLITPSEYIEKHPQMQVSSLCPSSWGYQGFNEVWLNGSNEWIYRHLHKASEKMIELSNMYNSPSPHMQNALNQAARELLLAQSSDWAFIMKTGTMVEYAVKRVKTHLHRFNKLYEDIKQDSIDTNWLDSIQGLDNIFPDLHHSVYSSN